MTGPISVGFGKAAHIDFNKDMSAFRVLLENKYHNLKKSWRSWDKSLKTLVCAEPIDFLFKASAMFSIFDLVCKEVVDRSKYFVFNHHRLNITSMQKN